ncbi:transcriptional regulator [Streptomyces sp. CNQ-509]|uniref:YciI family protein n=1 Tax=unclassified Streptomyces TaxID=2593676 RepID=UPI00062DF09E|nr:YciI family protein [Streptomyces sp. CNQ-509]AKH82874.1 transcriptional regulator [Streptomyces sp. CNQ-509]
MRYMMLIEPDLENSPADGMPSQEVMDEMGKLLEEMTKSGVLLDTAGLKPNEEAVRVVSDHGKISVVDGPFTESKELVGGYLIAQVKSKEEAMEWANRFLKAHGEEWTITVELREIMEP